MAIKAIVSEVNSNDGMLPLVADYAKENKGCIGKPFDVLTVTISRSGKWLMLDTDLFRVMFNIASKEAKQLISFFKELSNHEADKLVAVPAKTKKGVSAMIGADDSERREYLWLEDELIIAQLGELTSSAKSTELTLEGFQATPLLTAKPTENKKTQKRTVQNPA